MSNRDQEQEVLGAGPACGGEGIGAQELSLGFSSLWGGSAWGPCAGLSPVSTRRNLSSASQATRQKMRECHGLVDREPFHLRCLAAVCGCAPGRDCLCPVLAAYAWRCAQEGALPSWRNRTFCRESAQPASCTLTLLPAQGDPGALQQGRVPEGSLTSADCWLCFLLEARGQSSP